MAIATERLETALVVDDNPHARTIVGTILHATGFKRLREAGDVVDAFELLSAWRPDVVIVDQAMKPMSGTEFSSMLRRARDHRANDVPIIMVTAHTDLRTIFAARDAGIDEILAKPISVSTLLDRLNAVSNARREFIRSAAYVGPDRRRRRDPSYRGPERRGAAPKTKNGVFEID